VYFGGGGYTARFYCSLFLRDHWKILRDCFGVFLDNFERMLKTLHANILHGSYI